MIAVPAVDVRSGRCVQLEGGDPAKERITLPDPLSVAREWIGYGFSTLHVVDLDAALGLGDNSVVVRDLAALPDVTVQVGGGIRSDEATDRQLANGAARVIVGTRALEDPNLDWLRELAEARPGRVILAADVLGDRVLTRGWTEESGWRMGPLLDRIARVPLAGILVTDVGREGRLVGIDPHWTRDLVNLSPLPVWISGGIESMDDIRAGADAGAAGAVIGMALYTGRIDAAQLAKEFGRDPSTP